MIATDTSFSSLPKITVVGTEIGKDLWPFVVEILKYPCSDHFTISHVTVTRNQYPCGLDSMVVTKSRLEV